MTTGDTLIKIKRSETVGSVPTGLTAGELAINIADQRVFVGNESGNTVTLFAGPSAEQPAGQDGQLNFMFNGGFSASDNLYFSGSTLGITGGITMSGDLNLGGNLLLPEDGEVKIGGDTEKIVFNGAGSGSSSIDMFAANIDFGTGGGSALRSAGDADTQIKFVNDKHGAGSDGLELQQSGNVMVDVTPTQVIVGGATFGSVSDRGATFGGDVQIRSAGDVALYILADTDNATETDNPLIRLSQDNNYHALDIGIGQFQEDTPYFDTDNDVGIDFATDGTKRMRIEGTGTHGTGTVLFHGGISAEGGATFGGNVNVGSYIEFPDGTTLDGTQKDTIGISLRTGNQNFLTTGNKGIRVIPYKCSVDSWTVYSPSQGSIQFDINSGGHAQWPNLTSVAGSSLPSLSNQTSARDGTVNWTKTTFAAGDILEFHVDSVSGLTACTLCLNIIRRG